MSEGATQGVTLGTVSDEEGAAHLGISVEEMARLRAQVEETDRKLDSGLPRIELLGRLRAQTIDDYLAAARVTGRIPLDESGPWRVEEIEVTEHDEYIGRMRAILSSSSRGRWAPAGTYTRLVRINPGNGPRTETETTVMTDTPDEILDLLPLHDAVASLRAKRVIVNGLGLGCAVRLALASESVERVDVVEFSADVIRLVGPTLDPERVVIHEGDAYSFRFPPGTRWDVAWHDIWDDISIDNDFATLHRRYGGRVRYQRSWCRDQAIEGDRRWHRENAWWLNRAVEEDS